MDTEEQTIENIKESLVEQDNAGNMAPLETEDSESGYVDQKNNSEFQQKGMGIVDSDDGACSEKETSRVISTDGEMDDAEDGEILEDGEIASDQDVEVNNDNCDTSNQENVEDEAKSESSKSSPIKSQSGSHKDEHGRRGLSKKERHSKRHRTSKDESHSKQKKKRYRERSEYEKDGNEYEGQWPSDRHEKGERKRDRSPQVPIHSPSHSGEDRAKRAKDGVKRRKGSGEARHRGSHKDRDGEKNKDRSGDNHVDKDRKDHERHGKDRKTFEDHDSPPGIYDSPSEDEFSESRFEDKKPWNVAGPTEEEEFIEGTDTEAVGKSKRKPNKRKNNFEQRQPRAKEMADDFEEEQPVKKKPLLQTPMEERPICKFYKEGKCQKGSGCPFNHDYQVQKRFELCKYHLQSQCRKREECVFMHDFPCKYFHTGSTCYQGDNCKFSHSQLTPETEIALKNILNEKDELFEDHNFDIKKPRRKGLLGDQPAMSEQEVQRKLEHIRHIPSIFDIQTHAPCDSPNKPPPMGQSPNVCPQSFFQDNMSPHAGMNGPHMRFHLPANQGTPPNRPQFGPGGPGMDGPPMGPPLMVSGPGLLGPAPPPMMSGPGMQGPPMSQAAALVGAILRAAPMFQQFRGPLPQGQVTSLSNNMMGDIRFLGSNLMVPSPNIVQSVNMSIMSPGQDSAMKDGHQQGIMSENQQQNVIGQAQQQQNLILGQMNTGGSMRDPRKMAVMQNDPRLNRPSQDTEMHDLGDMDMRSADRSGKSVKENVADEDLRQDMDFRQDDGDKTPQQDWDDMGEINGCDDGMDIPAHLPPKQREMFMRIRQHTLKMKKEKSAQQNHIKVNKQTESKSQDLLKDDDNWYSSDEEDDRKPKISNILHSLNQTTEMKPEPGTGMSTTPSAINVMQMINKIKHSTPTSASGTLSNRLPMVTPGKQIKPREQAIIESRDGDCPWRLCKVLCVKQRIPNNVDLQDSKYKNDPRVQKILKLQELESGKVLDHTKAILPARKEPVTIEQELLDPNVFKEKKTIVVRPELTNFVGPNPVKLEKFGKPVQRPPDPRLKSGSEMLANKPADMHVIKSQSIQGYVGPSRPIDPRMARQDSNSNLNNFVNSVGLLADPRTSRLDSPEQSVSGYSTPPLDQRLLFRQSSIDPRSSKSDTVPLDFSAHLSKQETAQLTLDTEAESVGQSLLRQLSQPSTSAEREAASDIVSKPKLDYRNDPRFKRKPISESNLSPETIGKRFTGQRKSSTEYSSPLGGESSKVAESGYNSYNRPRVPKPQLQQSLSKNVSVVPMTAESVPIPTSDLTTHDILESLQIMPPPAIGDSQGPDKNLKDIFKTIDPTASPFC